MKIAAVGSFDGSLHQLYDEIKKIEVKKDINIDLVIICGNLQSCRCVHDLKCVDKLDNWKELNDFNQYYTGKKQANYLTMVVGGNHEASNYLKTLPYGGWLAKNIFYMGKSNVVNFNGLRIGGLSGYLDKTYDNIFNTEISKTGYFEKLPFDKRTIKSVAITRYLDIYRMLRLKGNLDLMFSFDYPTLDENSEKEFLREIPLTTKNDLGNEMYRKILDDIKPRYWLCGKHNYKFQSTIKHNSTNQETNFYSLKKFKTNQIEIIDIQSLETNEKTGLEYDLEFLAILKATSEYVNIDSEINNDLPNLDYEINLDKEKLFIKNLFKDNFKIERNFTTNKPVKKMCFFTIESDSKRTKNYDNNQNRLFCDLLKIKNINEMLKMNDNDSDDVQEKNNSFFNCPLISKNLIGNLYKQDKN